MDKAVFLLLALNFLFIGVLPWVFFKRGGTFNLMWWITSAPLFVGILLVAASFFRVAPSFTSPRLFDAATSELAAVVLSGGSMALIAFTVGTHRTPVSLWHQSQNTPQRLVTYGAYRFVRHPFYASFLLALLAAFLYVPHPGTFLALACEFLTLNFTAAKEERQLAASEFGAEYQAYMRRAGRFWPILRRSA